MSPSDPQFKLRIPAAVLERLGGEAKRTGRSITAEIVARLVESLDGRPRSVLRDEFAKAALPGLLIAWHKDAALDGERLDLSEQDVYASNLAGECYAMADAMLAAREVEPCA